MISWFALVWIVFCQFGSVWFNYKMALVGLIVAIERVVITSCLDTHYCRLLVPTSMQSDLTSMSTRL